MRVLITGATGFVGGRIAAHYADAGDDVTAVVRRPSSELDTLGVLQREGGLEAIDAGMLDGIDLVVHAAAAMGPDLADAREVNRDGTARLVDAAVDAGTSRVVHISTTSVYDRDAAGEGELDERAPLVTDGGPTGATSSARSAYAITKAEAEQVVGRAVDAGLSAAVLRPPAVLGAGPTSSWGTRVPRRIRQGKPPPIHPESSFGWVHVDDLVDAVVAASSSSDVFVANIVGGHVLFRDYLDAVVDILDETPPAPPAGEGPLPWRGRYNAERAPTLLGIPIERRFGDAMAQIADSWRAGDPGGGG